MHWLGLTLVSALSLASADATTKALMHNCSAREITLIRFGFSGLLVSPLLFFHPLPELPTVFWFWFGGLFPFEILAMLLYMRAIRDFPLAQTLPYMSLTPVFVILTGQLLLGESVTGKGLLGILLVVAGTWLLNIGHLRTRDYTTWLHPFSAMFSNPGSRLMVGVAALYSLTSVMGKGAMQYMPPMQFGAFYFASLGVATLIALGATSPALLRVLWRNPGANLLIGTLTGLMVVTHFLALQQVQVAYMIAVKRTSLLFGILYGGLLFKERGLGNNLFAGSLMVCGVFLIAV